MSSVSIDPAELRRLIERGLGRRQIAQIYGVSVGTIGRYKRRHKLYAHNVPKKRQVPWHLKEAFQHFVLDTAEEMNGER